MNHEMRTIFPYCTKMWTFHFCNQGALFLFLLPPPFSFPFSLAPLRQWSALCSCSSVVVCLFVSARLPPPASSSSPPPPPPPSLSLPLAHVNFAFRHAFFHCGASLLLIKVRKAADPTLARSPRSPTVTNRDAI